MVGKLSNIVGSSLLKIFCGFPSFCSYQLESIRSLCNVHILRVASTRVCMNTTESFSSMTKKDLEGWGHAYSDATMVSFGEEYGNNTGFSIIPHDQWAFTLQKHNAAAAKWLESLEAVPWMHCGADRRRGEEPKMTFRHFQHVLCIVLSPAGCNHVGLDLNGPR